MIYNINYIFNSNSTDGALKKHDAVQYYIAPYQRGYKWASFDPNDPVCLLLKDILNAAENDQSEYYLQFITTKVSENKGVKVLELIDGQQRLTTLTLLLSVLAYKIDESKTPASNHLLSYEVRPKVTEFFDNHIYKNIGTILSRDWEDFIREYPDKNEQDIYYLYKAAQRINKDLEPSAEKLKAIENYLLFNVKIILNNIDRDINCEEIFSNLNDNKVDLTSAELIKGLFLTRSARERVTNKKVTYREILEIRAVMGRQWDELAHWANRSDINAFFFKGRYYVLDELLLLLAISDGFKEDEEHLYNKDVFNFFQSQIQKGYKSTDTYFTELSRLKQILNDWFNDPIIHNLLGYLLFAKESKLSAKDILRFLYVSKSKIKSDLQKEVAKLLVEDVSKLEYGKHNNTIHDVLLALSVFNNANKFDFEAFANSKAGWSLEHIFPQTPEDLADILHQKDIILINSLLKNKDGDFESIRVSLGDLEGVLDIEECFNSLKDKLSLSECFITLDEKKVLYRLIKVENLNKIGNMALLTKSDNSSNKNGMFDKKRRNIAKRVSQGSFVPKHTYDVFAKLVSDKMTPELNVWSEQDINYHEEWISKTIKDLKQRFQ